MTSFSAQALANVAWSQAHMKTGILQIQLVLQLFILMVRPNNQLLFLQTDEFLTCFVHHRFHQFLRENVRQSILVEWNWN